ncbi:phage holin, lambda family [Vreelandella populi]|uniref:phage holin, lambda family n=1 Tax=Vreelandella populi TaxID=2498858 RepID=UPI000F8D102D|nr:phage holin, lambda family [Halomonas populi]RUR51406.1 phage holin, lambda family [Halomonas populi]
MPGRDPNLWQALLAYIATAWPQLYAAGLAFIVALVRGLHAGNPVSKSWLEALLCGCLTLAVFPVLHYLGLPINLAVAFGAVIAFKGAEWFSTRADELYDRLIRRWLK